MIEEPIKCKRAMTFGGSVNSRETTEMYHQVVSEDHDRTQNRYKLYDRNCTFSVKKSTYSSDNQSQSKTSNHKYAPYVKHPVYKVSNFYI